MPTNGALRCHNCKRRRWRCDGAVPHCKKCTDNGIECLGYGKILQWIGGMASRGNLTEENFREKLALVNSLGRKTSHPLQRKRSTRPISPISIEAQHSLSPRASGNGQRLVLKASPEAIYERIIVHRPLVDSMFQDLSYHERFFIDYCKLCKGNQTFMMHILTIWKTNADCVPCLPCGIVTGTLTE